MKLKQSKVVFYEDTHQYFNSKGEELIGVTSLMKKHGLSADYEGIPEFVLMRAARKGSAIHKDCEDGCAFDDYSTPEGKEYGKILKEEGIEIIATEYLVSDEKMVATKLDNLFVKGNLLLAGDIKSTSELHTEPLRWQLSIGKLLFEKMNKIKIDGLAAFWLRGESGMYVPIEPIPEEEVEKLLECERKGILYNYSKTEETTLPEQTQKAIEQISNIESFIIEAEMEVKRLKEQRDKYTSIIQETFAKSGIKAWETDKMKITLVAPTTAKIFDSKKFTEEHPEMAAQFTKESEKKGYIKITLKK